MERLINELFGEFFDTYTERQNFIYDKEQKVIKVVMPGVDKSDVKLSVKDGKVTIHIEKGELLKKPTTFTVYLPSGFTIDKAKLENGILKLTLKEIESGKEIQVE